MTRLALASLDRFAGFAPVVLRLFLGGFLIYMAQDNVFSAARMTEFEHFLDAFGFALPAVSARISVYAQFACGILILAGALTRWAALVMIVNFIVAIVGVHSYLPVKTFLEPCAMLAASVALVLGGPGRLSIDAAIDAALARRAT